MLRWASLCALAAVLGCSAGPRAPQDNGSYDDNGSFAPPPQQPLEASTIEDDSGVLEIGDRPGDGGVDGGHTPPADGGAATLCSGPLAPGDLKIVEIMIASQSGSGDRGEWIEIQNTQSCIVDLNGLSVRSPRGTSTDEADVTTDVLVQPGASFVVADSADAGQNHALPTATLVATFDAYDVLKNGGDTIEIYAGTTLVDALTYPQLAITPGRSVSFPADCAWSDRSSWARWSLSFHVWSSSFQGTPGADNTDVTCY
jgi:hypothetical protein